MYNDGRQKKKAGGYGWLAGVKGKEEGVGSVLSCTLHYLVTAGTKHCS